MSDWLIIVENASDLGQHETPHKVMRTRDYLASPSLFTGRRPNIINLARSYAYQSNGYYAALLAEARLHRIAPDVQSIVELGQKSLYQNALPDLDAALIKDLDAAGDAFGKDDKKKKRALEARPAALPSRFLVFFNRPQTGADLPLERFGRTLFDWFRMPIVEVNLSEGERVSIQSLKPVALSKLKDDERTGFIAALDAHTRRRWAGPKAKGAPKWSLAVLIDPKEAMPPSSPGSIKKLAAVAERMGVEVEPIYPNELSSLAQFDALFIRATTAIDNYTYRFARRAEQETMPTIDDPRSMIRCTNKVYLKELLEKGGVAMPHTEIFDDKADFAKIFQTLGAPAVLKAPDGSFSRSVQKAATLEEFKARAGALLKDSALVLAQEYMPTDFDWRIGVLGGEPLFACRYKMASGHWQIVRYDAKGAPRYGGADTVALDDAPPLVVETAVKAARLIGDGLYGVDLKETAKGVVVIEINDNPNLDAEYEGAILKDALWRKLIEGFSARLERKLSGGR